MSGFPEKSTIDQTRDYLRTKRERDALNEKYVQLQATLKDTPEDEITLQEAESLKLQYAQLSELVSNFPDEVIQHAIVLESAAALLALLESGEDDPEAEKELITRGDTALDVRYRIETGQQDADPGQYLLDQQVDDVDEDL